MKRCSSRLILWQVALIDLRFIEEQFASPATGKITYCLWLLPKRAPLWPPITPMRFGRFDQALRAFHNGALSNLSLHCPQCHRATKFPFCCPRWGSAVPSTEGTRAATAPATELSHLPRRRSVAFPWGTIKRYCKFHFVVTTGYRNCISCIRWSHRNIQEG